MNKGTDKQGKRAVKDRVKILGSSPNKKASCQPPAGKGALESSNCAFRVMYRSPCPQDFSPLPHPPRAAPLAKGQPDAKSPGLSCPRAMKGDLKYLFESSEKSTG